MPSRASVSFLVTELSGVPAVVIFLHSNIPKKCEEKQPQRELLKNTPYSSVRGLRPVNLALRGALGDH